MGVLLNHIALNRNLLPSRPLENSRVIRDSPWHRKATLRANREGHGSLAGRRIIGGMRRTVQGPGRGKDCIYQGGRPRLAGCVQPGGAQDFDDLAVKDGNDGAGEASVGEGRHTKDTRGMEERQ